MDPSPSYRAQIGDALDLLYEVLRPFVEREMREAYGDEWIEEARSVLHGKAPERWDTSDLLMLIYKRFFRSFSEIGHEGRSRVSLLKEVRTKWAHQADLSVADTRRALENTILLLRAVGADEEADQLEPQVAELMKVELDIPMPRTLSREPLELHRDLLDAVEDAVAPHRKNPQLRGLTVHVLAADDEARFAAESAVEGQEDPFPEAVRRRLTEAGVRDADRLRVHWVYHAEFPVGLDFGGRPFTVELHRRPAEAAATLTVVRGRADQEWYLVKSDAPVPIGRTEEVTDRRGRVIHRNRIVFAHFEGLDDEARRVNRTVSRAHATLDFDETTGSFHLRDDKSTAGTSIIREHFPVPVPVKRHPVPLESGDLIYLGKACLRFTRRDEP